MLHFEKPLVIHYFVASIVIINSSITTTVYHHLIRQKFTNMLQRPMTWTINVQ